MNAMIAKIIDEVSKIFPLKELEVGEMSALKAKSMKYTICAYYAEGLGHVSVMSAKGFFGLMKMDTVIINPTEKDLPLYSYDNIKLEESISVKAKSKQSESFCLCRRFIEKRRSVYRCFQKRIRRRKNRRAV